jgi:hypothetical protein
VTTASPGLIHSTARAVRRTIVTSEEKSMRFTERKLQIRSVSLPTRDIRSPVRREAKKSSDMVCMWE